MSSTAQVSPANTQPFFAAAAADDPGCLVRIGILVEAPLPNRSTATMTEMAVTPPVQTRDAIEDPGCLVALGIFNAEDCFGSVAAAKPRRGVSQGTAQTPALQPA